MLPIIKYVYPEPVVNPSPLSKWSKERPFIGWVESIGKQPGTGDSVFNVKGFFYVDMRTAVGPTLRMCKADVALTYCAGTYPF